jgi:hypothetical protein
MAKRVLRSVIKAVAGIAGVVFLLDNHLEGTSGLVFFASIGVLLLCLVIWLIFGLADEHEDADQLPGPKV